MLANVMLVVIWLGICAYAIFGGADFGGGIWDLFAGDAARGARPRRLIANVIGPVWEANHVWLIFVLVYLWTAFPEAFAAIASTMYIPLTLAAFGIIFRGSGFAFRKWATTTSKARAFGAAFAGASFVTPFFLGAVAGGVASGRVPLGNAAGSPFGSWLNPTSILGGSLAVVSCAFLAAVLLTHEAAMEDDSVMEEYFRIRALVSGALAGVIALVGVGVLRADAAHLFEGLTSWPGIIVMVASALGGLATMALMVQRRFVAARLTAVLATVSVLWGWGVGQYPDVLPGEVTVAASAASDPVLIAMLVAFGAAGIIVVPALVFLYSLTQRGTLGEAGGVDENSTEALLSRLRAESQD